MLPKIFRGSFRRGCLSRSDGVSVEPVPAARSAPAAAHRVAGQAAGGVQTYGVVVVTACMPRRLRMGVLSGEASTWR